MSRIFMFDIPRFQKFSKLRIVICAIAWMSLVSLYAQRINLSIAIIGMVNSKAGGLNNSSNKDHKNSVVYNKTTRYDWSEANQNYALFSYNLGYLAGHIPGAILALKFGSRSIMMFALFVSSILSIFSFLTVFNYTLFFALRVVIGFVNGPLYPILQEIIASHALPKERTIFAVLTHSGNIIALIFTFPIGGLLLENVINGWYYIFIMTGLSGILPLILWILFVYGDPDENPWMSRAEQELIKTSIHPKGKPLRESLSSIPYKQILTSPIIYLLLLAHFAKLFILYMNLFGLVKYLFSYYNLTELVAGNLAVIPFVGDFLVQLVYPKTVPLMKKLNLSLTSIRKINTLIGAIGSCTFLIISGFLPPTNLVAGMIVLTLSLAFLAPYQAGYFTAIIEIDPVYALFNMAVINIGGSSSGVVQRYITAAFMTNLNDKRLAYRYSFIVTGVTSFLLSLPFVFFGTSDRQPWAMKDFKNYDRLTVSTNIPEPE